MHFVYFVVEELALNDNVFQRSPGILWATLRGRGTIYSGQSATQISKGAPVLLDLAL